MWNGDLGEFRSQFQPWSALMTEFIRKIAKGHAQNVLHHETETGLIALRTK
jgi:hypothetical protein